MKFLPVAALTASISCVMSASLKFGVMRGPFCCALALPASTSTAARAQTAPARLRTEAGGIFMKAVRFYGYSLASDDGSSTGGGSGSSLVELSAFGALTGPGKRLGAAPGVKVGALRRAAAAMLSASFATVSRLSVTSCDWPLRRTVTLALAEEDKVCRISLAR